MCLKINMVFCREGTSGGGWWILIAIAGDQYKQGDTSIYNYRFKFIKDDGIGIVLSFISN
jgi:hypothetical protein